VVADRVTASENETQAVGREVAATLHAGDVLLLSGDLGSGKTTFVRGLAEGLGIDPAEVSSPTYTLVHEYRGDALTLYHADLYRLERAATDDLGLEEIGVKDGILAIEWPDRLSHELPGAKWVRLEVVNEESRRITFGPPDGGPYDRT
jgi:tRNA threonylcarbamoyladenosine biosynthesis protein TsaE